MIQVWPTIERFLTEHGAAYRRLDKALGPELGQCCGGRVVVTLEQSGAADLDRVGRLAAVECAGGLTTVAEPGHLNARTAVAADMLPRSVRCARLSDGRVAERLGSDAT